MTLTPYAFAREQTHVIIPRTRASAAAGSRRRATRGAQAERRGERRQPMAPAAGAHSLCSGPSFTRLVREGDKLTLAWFDRGETNEERCPKARCPEERGSDRGDEGCRAMNHLAASGKRAGSRTIFVSAATCLVDGRPLTRTCAPSNRPSKRLPQKLGYLLCGEGLSRAV